MSNWGHSGFPAPLLSHRLRLSAAAVAMGTGYDNKERGGDGVDMERLAEPPSPTLPTVNPNAAKSKPKAGAIPPWLYVV